MGSRPGKTQANEKPPYESPKARLARLKREAREDEHLAVQRSPFETYLRTGAR